MGENNLCLSFVVAVIGGTILSIPEVGAQSTGGDSTSCESSTLDEAVNLFKRGMNNIWLIREDLKAVNVIREDLENVKNVLESNQQQNNATCISKSDFEDLTAAFDALIQQQNNTTISKNDFEDLKTACASNQQQCRQTELSNQAAASLLLCEYITGDRCFL